MNIRVGVAGGVGGLLPVGLHLSNQAVLALLSALLDLMTLRREVAVELVGVPAIVGLDNIVLPIALNQVLEVFAVGWSGVWNVVVRKPSVKQGKESAHIPVKKLVSVLGQLTSRAQSRATCCKLYGLVLVRLDPREMGAYN